MLLCSECSHLGIECIGTYTLQHLVCQDTKQLREWITKPESISPSHLVAGLNPAQGSKDQNLPSDGCLVADMKWVVGLGPVPSGQLSMLLRVTATSSSLVGTLGRDAKGWTGARLNRDGSLEVCWQESLHCPCCTCSVARWKHSDTRAFSLAPFSKESLLSILYFLSLYLVCFSSAAHKGPQKTPNAQQRKNLWKTLKFHLRIIKVV